MRFIEALAGKIQSEYVAELGSRGKRKRLPHLNAGEEPAVSPP